MVLGGAQQIFEFDRKVLREKDVRAVFGDSTLKVTIGSFSLNASSVNERGSCPHGVAAEQL